MYGLGNKHLTVTTVSSAAAPVGKTWASGIFNSEHETETKVRHLFFSKAIVIVNKK